MGTALVLLLVMGVISVMSSTPEGRAEASAKLAHWNPLFAAILFAELAFIFWPR